MKSSLCAVCWSKGYLRAKNDGKPLKWSTLCKSTGVKTHYFPSSQHSFSSLLRLSNTIYTQQLEVKSIWASRKKGVWCILQTLGVFFTSFQQDLSLQGTPSVAFRVGLPLNLLCAWERPEKKGRKSDRQRQSQLDMNDLRHFWVSLSVKLLAACQQLSRWQPQRFWLQASFYKTGCHWAHFGCWQSHWAVCLQCSSLWHYRMWYVHAIVPKIHSHP